MSFNQGAYDTSLAYGKFKDYTGATVATIIGIVLVILSIFIVVSYFNQPKTNVDNKNNTPEQKQQNAPWWTGPMVFGFALISFLTAFYYYKLATSTELAPVVATQGALAIGSDVSYGLRNIILGEKQN